MNPNSSKIIKSQLLIERDHYAINEQFKQKEVEEQNDKN
jgi:hypothetical protein